MMTVFPIGTSRLHEPLELAKNAKVEFPGIGYFHSSSQILDVINIITKEARVDLDIARFFFRRDQTQTNKFDLNLWGEGVGAALERTYKAFLKSDVLLIEISSPNCFLLDDFHVQGNPNCYRNVPYSEVWKDGYYSKFNPELMVRMYEDYDCVEANLGKISGILNRLGKSAIVLGHLVDRGNPNAQRAKNNKSISDAITSLGAENLTFYDQSHLVGKYGFRLLDDKTVDIHHLPWIALEDQIEEMLGLAQKLVQGGVPCK